MNQYYHFTSEIHLETILKCGYLKTTESNVGSPHHSWPPAGDHYGPDVVWLTDLDTPSKPLGLAPPPTELLPPGASWDPKSYKDKVRFTLELPADEVHQWRQWAFAQGTHPDWFKCLAAHADPKHCFLIERQVPSSEWVVIHVWDEEIKMWVPLERGRAA